MKKFNHLMYKPRKFSIELKSGKTIFQMCKEKTLKKIDHQIYYLGVVCFPAVNGMAVGITWNWGWGWWLRYNKDKKKKQSTSTVVARPSPATRRAYGFRTHCHHDGKDKHKANKTTNLEKENKQCFHFLKNFTSQYLT